MIREKQSMAQLYISSITGSLLNYRHSETTKNTHFSGLSLQGILHHLVLVNI